MEPVRILQINYSMDLGGAETLIMNIYRKIDRSKVQFDFLLHCPEESAYEKEINSLGGRIFRLPRYKVFNKLSYERHLKCFLEDHPEFEIIHAHMMDSASETLRTAKKLGRKTIAHSHTAGVPFSTEEMIRFFFRRKRHRALRKSLDLRRRTLLRKLCDRKQHKRNAQADQKETDIELSSFRNIHFLSSFPQFFFQYFPLFRAYTHPPEKSWIFCVSVV